jgi:ribosomal protein L37AE/L43A
MSGFGWGYPPGVTAADIDADWGEVPGVRDVEVTCTECDWSGEIRAKSGDEWVCPVCGLIGGAA